MFVSEVDRLGIPRSKSESAATVAVDKLDAGRPASSVESDVTRNDWPGAESSSDGAAEMG